MQAKVVSKVTIDATSPQVFLYLSDNHKHFFWNPHLQSIKPKMALTKGCSYDTVSLFLGKEIRATNEVTVLRKDRELEIQNDTGTLHYRVNYQLKSEGKKTVVTCGVVVEAKSNAFAFATPVLKKLASRELQSDLQALKLAVEQQL